MATNPIVLKVECGSTLKTVINGQPVEIECDSGRAPGGDTPGHWEPPPPPTSRGGVIAYIRQPSEGPQIDLSALTARYQAGQLAADDLPPADPGEEWAVYRDPGGDFKSLGSITEG